MEQTQIQNEIERQVTNGLGYRGFSQLDFERATNLFYHQDDLDLQQHLGMLEYATADNDLSKQLILGLVMDMGKVRQQLVAYGLEGQVNFGTPNQVNAAVAGLYRTQEAKKRERENPMRIQLKTFDAYDAQQIATRDLEFSLHAKPFQSALIKPREEEQRDLDNWYSGRTAEIDRAERRFQARLNVALEDGEVDSFEASKLQTGSMFSPFGRLRERAREDYSHLRK